MITWALDTMRLAKRDPSRSDGRASPGAASQGWDVVMVLNGSNENVRKYTLDTALPASREGSRRDPGALPLATSQGYTWGLALGATRPATRAGLRGNPQVSPAAASQGLDLSGTIHGAGGIGGLLASYHPTGGNRYWYFYDANDNVGQVLDTTDTGNISIAARYEYDPYGNLILSSGPYKDANPFRFSTKWYDVETDMYYFGYRYYLSRLGRWGNEDPLGEIGGLNLYAYVHNAPVSLIDLLGLAHCAWVTAKDAFGIPGFRFLGGAHLALELDRDGKKTLIELQAFNDKRHSSANRVGSGPLGPMRYIYYALTASWFGLSGREDLRRINAICERIFGFPAISLIDLLDGAGQASEYGTGLLNFYGLYVSPDLTGRGKRFPVPLTPGLEAEQLDRLEEAARQIGEKAERAQMVLSANDLRFNTRYGQFIIDKFSIGIVVGLGYDPLLRNSNSFIGTVFRQAGVQPPVAVQDSLGFDRDFTQWTWWDLEFHKMFQDAFADAMK